MMVMDGGPDIRAESRSEARLDRLQPVPVPQPAELVHTEGVAHGSGPGKCHPMCSRIALTTSSLSNSRST
jgi:hypothetical protein